MGAVYEVTDQRTQRRRALKVMLPNAVQDADLRARFKLEATVTARVESDHIVETFDADVDAASAAPFLVMELLRGEDLGTILANRGSLTPEEAIALLQQAALALDKTHAVGVVHRDLKPENLFVARADDGSPRLKILDFGIAKIVEAGGGAPSTRIMGTPAYMSPEQIRGDGDIDGRADLYALAHIAYALLVGEPYWAEDARKVTQFALLNLIVAGCKESPSARALRRGVILNDAFDAWFVRATAREATDRFDGAASMIAALEALRGRLVKESSQRGPNPSGLVQEPARRSPPSGQDGEVPLTLRAKAALASAPTQRSAEDPRRAELSSAPVTVGARGMEHAWRRSMAFTTVGAIALVGVAIGAFSFRKQGSDAARASEVPASRVPIASAPPVSSASGEATSVPFLALSAPTSEAPASRAPPPDSAARPSLPSLPAVASEKPRAAPRRLVPPPPASAPAPAPAPDCNPPYEIDSMGIRVRKPQCW
jgi:serine/threonine-protein kinase